MGDVFLVTHIPEHLRDMPDLCFEVKTVDAFGHVLDSVFVDCDGHVSDPTTFVVPSDVIDAARRLAVGQSEYVDEHGAVTYPGRESKDQEIQGVYFVRRLPPHDRRPGQEEGQIFQIQVVNQHGQAVKSGFIDSQQHSLVIDNHRVPKPVIERALRQPEGPGIFVTSDGEETVP